MNYKKLAIENYELVVQAELASGLTSIISIHSTKRGPALGGVRFFPYASMDDAMKDVLHLSEAMSYKAALANVPLGGGKAVIMGDPEKHKTRQVLESFGEFVESLEGKYITAKDVGIGVSDLEVIASKAKHVTGTDLDGSSGDPSYMTALGVYTGMQACCEAVYQSDSLAGKRVIVQGLGKVGWELVQYLLEEKAEVYASEKNEEIIQRAEDELDITLIQPKDWTKVEADIFAPCALGFILNQETIEALCENEVKIIAGGANNQLATPEDGLRLHQKGVLYAPDYVINAGGLINISCELGKEYDAMKAKDMTLNIGNTLKEIFSESRQKDLPTSEIALQKARQKVFG